MRVAVLGMGAMGSRMATALLKAGHAVTVWNRTEARAQPLVDQGATLAKSPRAAAAGSEFVLSMVRDDEASREVWLSADDGALPTMSKDQIGVATGLAWTAVGGDVLFIEALRLKGKGNLVLTGQIGEIMRESAQAAQES